MIIKVFPETRIAENEILDGEGYKNVRFRDIDGHIWRLNYVRMRFESKTRQAIAYVTAVVCVNGQLSELYLSDLL